MSKISTTAGIVVIGDEILKGSVKEGNCQLVCLELRKLGTAVKRIEVIPDDVEIIGECVRKFSQQYTYVITSGGIGPTHDDMTFEGVARAFGEHVQLNAELADKVSKFFNLDLAKDAARPEYKLATIPASATLNYGTDTDTGLYGRYPVVSVGNVYVLPGVPTLFRRGFGYIKHKFRNPDVTIHYREIYCTDAELALADMLTKLQNTFGPEVTIGSYPSTSNNYYQTRLTVDSTDETKFEACIGELESELSGRSAAATELLPGQTGALLRGFDSQQLTGAYEKLHRLLSAEHLAPDFRQALAAALAVVERCFDTYRLDEIAISFNGGKDCTALLHLVHAVMDRRGLISKNGLTAVYFRNKSFFPEVDRFVRLCVQRYSLNLVELLGPIKPMLSQLKQDKPNVKAVLMGCRITDPRCEQLESFQITDAGWPDYMRVNPLLSWSYHDVWTFLRSLWLPYCHLYDQGYTSLGNPTDTRPNPALLHRAEPFGAASYLPAYQLENADEERLARKRSQSHST